MWQSVLSIDKKFEREYSYIINSINRCDKIAYAVEESLNRYHINIATNEENIYEVKPFIEDIITDIILVFIKYDYLLQGIRFNNQSYLNAALLSALVYCDRSNEKDIILENIKDVYEYSIDGLYNFRMNDLIDNWDEVIILVNGLIHSNHTSSDIYSLIDFILEMSEDSKCILKITKCNDEIVIHNVTQDKIIDIPQLSETNYANIITAIISANPYEIHLEKELLNSEIINVVNNIVRLKTI